MGKTRKQLLLAAAAVITLAGCKKVIDVDLKNVAPQIVIEGEIANVPGPYYVRVSKTVNFSASNVFPPVTNAVVSVKDSSNGINDEFVQVDSGLYRSQDMIGVQGHTYVLSVTVDGKQYKASSRMPKAVFLDSVTFALNYGVNNEQQINAVMNFQDPQGLGNYYQFTEAVNGRAIPNIFVFEDRLSDGRYIQQPLFNDSAYLKKGDTLTATMNCVDKNIYTYFFTLANVTGNNNFQTSTPANPVTNITGGALGYFSAHTTQKTRIQVY